MDLDGAVTGRYAAHCTIAESLALESQYAAFRYAVQCALSLRWFLSWRQASLGEL